MKQLRDRWQDIVVPGGIIACLLLIFMPLPASLIDVLLSANIAISVLILLATVYVRSPLELSVFPSLLLTTTFARLALSIATTRLILSQGAHSGEAAAGHVIQAFAQFVTGNNLMIGVVMFAIIMVVQFVVITKGATRISEVAARFALDGLPGRQMAIDAELNAGTITAEQAKTLRAETIEHADFYGAMDGASKFVRGDAVAGIVIVFVNLIGGLCIGLYQNMAVADAVNTFTRLTIGDGLVTQLPALLISLAAALLITRSTRQTDLPRESVQQIFGSPMALVLTAVFLSLLVMTDLPKLPLLVLSAGCLAAARFLKHEDRETQSAAASAAPHSPATTTSQDWSIEKLLASELIEMELGRGLIRLADTSQGGGLLGLVTRTRQRLAAEWGIILPKIRVRDNLSIGPHEFQILVQGNPVFKSTIDPQSLLAIDRGRATSAIESQAVRGVTQEGFLNWQAFWIHPDAFESSLARGYEVLTAEEVLAEQLMKTAQRHAPLILTRDATKQLIDDLHRRSPAVVDELLANQVTVGQVQQILKSLLEQGVSIRPLELILETLGDNAKLISNRWELVEKVRIRLGRHITSKLQDAASGSLIAVAIDESLQQRIACGWERKQDEIQIGVPQEIIANLVTAIEGAATKLAAAGYLPVVLVSQEIRPVIAELVCDIEPRIYVLGNREVQGTDVQVLAEISSEQVAGVRSAA